jgi:hypothetical protein
MATRSSAPDNISLPRHTWGRQIKSDPVLLWQPRNAGLTTVGRELSGRSADLSTGCQVTYYGYHLGRRLRLAEVAHRLAGGIVNSSRPLPMDPSISSVDGPRGRASHARSCDLQIVSALGCRNGTDQIGPDSCDPQGSTGASGRVAHRDSRRIGGHVSAHTFGNIRVANDFGNKSAPHGMRPLAERKTPNPARMSVNAGGAVEQVLVMWSAGIVGGDRQPGAGLDVVDGW